MGSEQDPYALLAWKAQVLHKARRASPGLQAENQALDVHTLKRLVSLSAAVDGPTRAIDVLREHGIILVFEQHMPSTHLDGAAMLLNDAVPVVGLTLRYDRLDNFWFVLLHEVGHVVLHRERGLREGFFDEDIAALQDASETEADEFAQSAFIPNELWKRSFVRFTESSEQVQKFALQRRIGAAIVAGRIRKERKDYTLFNELVGSGTVRKLITDAGYWES